MDRCALPHGARGIEGDGFAVEFRDDKIVFVPKSTGDRKHFTLHTGPGSGVMDVHETTSVAEAANSTARCSPCERTTSCRYYRSYR